MAELTILYVEDDPVSRQVMEMLCTHLLPQDIELIIFADSHNFRERIEVLPVQPDLIFLDIHVAPYGGFDMLDMLRSMPDYRDTKIIALTASVMNEEVEALQDASFDGGIAKPIRQDTFEELIEQILNDSYIWYID